MRTTVIYHANCTDGLAAAAVFYKYAGDSAEYFAAKHGSSTYPSVRGSAVYLLDFCYPLAIMEAICEEAASVTLIDHHKSALELVEHLSSRYPNFNAQPSNNDHSGAVLTWQHLYGSLPVPAILTHVQDRDLWQFKYEHTEEIVRGLYAANPTLKQLAGWLGEGWPAIQPLLATGKALLKEHRMTAKRLAASAHPVEIAGHVVLAVNAPAHFASDVGALLYEETPATFVAVYHINRDLLIFSLRSSPTGIDVSEIAKKYGGGGHKHAAGFSIPYKVPNVT